MAQSSEKCEKNANKSKEIEQKIKNFKDQFSKMSEIIQQKENKIQEYRQQIFSLRQKFKASILEKERIENEMTKANDMIDCIIGQKDELNK